MARRSELGQEHFDLLPFINILMCTLGCLLLIALSMASLSLSSAGEEWIAEGRSAGQDTCGMKPILFIWDGTSLVAQLEQKLVCVAWPPDGPAAAPTCPPGSQQDSFESVLRYLRVHRSDRYPLIAVRPTGFDGFDSVKDAFNHEDIEVGYEPISQSKRVQISVAECRR